MSITVAKDQLRSIIERIERLEEEKKAVADDIGEIYAEAKAFGFDTKALRAIVRLRKQDPEQRAEQEAILGVYLVALDMVGDGGEPTDAAREHIDEMAKRARRKERADA